MKKVYEITHLTPDEKMELKSLLNNKGIDVYETPPGRHGVPMDAIWVSNDSQYSRARMVVAEYDTLKFKNASNAIYQKQSRIYLFIKQYQKPIIFTIALLFSFLLIAIVI